MNENLSLGRIAGIHVGLNWSLLVIAALIAWSLATGILPSTVPGQTSGAYWTAGVVSAFVYLASLLAHSLIWLRTGDRLRATHIAAGVGMAFAFLFIGYRLLTLFASGSLIGGLYSL